MPAAADANPRELGRRVEGPGHLPVERCHEHVPALYLLAYLIEKNNLAAERAVVDAVVAAGKHPSLPLASRARTWQMLAAHVGRCDPAGLSPPPCPREALLSAPAFRHVQAVALLSVGRRAEDAAELLGVSAPQVRLDAGAGMRLLRDHLVDPAPPAWLTGS